MDPPGKKFKREDTSTSEESTEENSEEELTDLDRWLLDPQALKDEQEFEDACILERLGNPDQQAEAWAWLQNKEEQLKMKQKVEDEKLVDNNPGEENIHNPNNDDQSDAESINSTDDDFIEKMLGGKIECKDCGKFPCE